jgi:hypothetical protein
VGWLPPQLGEFGGHRSVGGGRSSHPSVGGWPCEQPLLLGVGVAFSDFDFFYEVKKYFSNMWHVTRNTT